MASIDHTLNLENLTDLERKQTLMSIYDASNAEEKKSFLRYLDEILVSVTVPPVENESDQAAA